MPHYPSIQISNDTRNPLVGARVLVIGADSAIASRANSDDYPRIGTVTHVSISPYHNEACAGIQRATVVMERHPLSRPGIESATVWDVLLNDLVDLTPPALPTANLEVA